MGNVGHMNDHETNPQRHETPSPEPSHRPADAPFGGSSPERGESGPVAAHATTATQPAAPGADEPTAAQPTVAQPVAAPQSGGWGGSPWQRDAYGHQQHPGYGQAAYAPPSQQPYGYPQQTGYAGSAPHQAHPGPFPGRPGPQPGAEQPPVVPPWAQPVGVDQRDPARAGRGRRIFVAGAAAVLIALAGGGIGAATVLAMDDGGIAAVQTGNSSVTRVVDRSSLAQIAAAVQDSVVSIDTGSGEGSGVVLSADGYVLTNNHVVATAQGDTVDVVFANGKKATARIVGTDARTDLAVVKANDVSGLKPAALGDSAKMQVGDTVLALGSPLGLEGSVTAGIISAKDRTIRSNPDQQTPQDPFGGGRQQQQAATSMSGLLQTDAPINPGNSGGALVNTAGEVIGINTAIATSGQGSGSIGLGFAIPSNKAKQVADDLIAGNKVSHPALGVSVTEAEGGGALVNSVTPDSAAAKAGLQQGDVVTQVNGKAVNDSDDLVGIVQSGKVGDRMTIQFTRDGAQKTVTATLAESQ
jgi:putative serine protease PepD